MSLGCHYWAVTHVTQLVVAGRPNSIPITKCWAGEGKSSEGEPAPRAPKAEKSNGGDWVGCEAGRRKLTTKRWRRDELPMVRVCGKRLKALAPILIESLERHGHLKLDEAVRKQLHEISPATIPPPRYSLGHPFGDDSLRGAHEYEEENIPTVRGSGGRPPWAMMTAGRTKESQ